MATRYADIIDPQNIREIIPSDWQFSKGLVMTGAVGISNEVQEGTQESFIREKLFQSDEDGQAVGVGSDVNLKVKTQTEYKIPIVHRADGAQLDDIEGDIGPKRQARIEDNFREAVLDKSSKMFDGVAIAIAKGIAKFQEAENENFLDTGATQIALTDIAKVKATRGDMGQFQGGFMVMEGSMFQKMVALGLVSESTNTMGVNAKDAIVRAGIFSSVVGMTPILTDRITGATGDTDQYIMLLEAEALILKGAGIPDIDPIVRSERGFRDIAKFKIKTGGTVYGMAWKGAKSDLITNADLSTAANWERAKEYSKNVKMATLRVPAPVI